MQTPRILTPDQRLRVFVSSTLQELGPERAAARAAIESLQLTPVLFELGARPHPPQTLYRAYLEQSQIFVGIYWQSYGWVAPEAEISGIEDELQLSARRPRLLYIKEPAPEREPQLAAMLDRVRDASDSSFKRFQSADELRALVADDLALLVSERFTAADEAEGRHTARVPTPTTSLVGRSPELAQIDDLLARGSVRLLTLTGPGGIGKTRLATEAARRLEDRYPDGAVFVPLDGISDPALVVPAIATAVGVRELVGDPLDVLGSYLQRRNLLLVLDNFEQVIGAAPAVGTLLERAPELTVVVTSREVLRVRGEHELRVLPLDPDREAVELFAERAATAAHVFGLAAADVPLVAEICRRLDGVPLAIELAAPRLRLLTPSQLLERLRERLALAGHRDAPARQQTLEAAIAWSYDLLTDEERRLFEQLGVFHGSFRLDAAEAVADVGEGNDVLELLASLLDKSIVYRLDDPSGPRFAMLVMIRDFARQRLAQSSEEEALARLAAFYLGFANRIEVGLRSTEQRRWKLLLDAEADNVRAVLSWLAEQGRASDLMICLRGIWMWFWLLGQIEECRRWSQRALELPGGTQGERGWAVAIDGIFAQFQGDWETSGAGLTEARGLLEAADDARGVAWVDLAIAVQVAAVDEEAAAQERVAQCFKTYTELDDAWGIAMSTNVTTWLRAIFGRFEGAEEVFERGLATAEAVGDEFQLVMALGSSAEAKLAAGDVDEARRHVGRALRLLLGSGSRYTAPGLLDTLASCAIADSDYSKAAELIGAADALREAMNAPMWGPVVERRARLVDDLRAELGAEAFAACHERGSTRSLDELVPAPATADRVG